MTEEEKGFVIKDKRRFSDEADKREEDAIPEEETQAKTEEEKPSEPSDQSETEDTALPEINFGTFVLSLNSSVLVQLGLVDDPVTGKNSKNLPLAKQTIDILGMLAEKTKGNLSDDEDKMLKHFLYELRMLYVKAK
jgi:hypothetical protein